MYVAAYISIQRIQLCKLRRDRVERLLLLLEKTCQKRRVSSPAPVTIDSPSGDIALKNDFKKNFNFS